MGYEFRSINTSKPMKKPEGFQMLSKARHILRLRKDIENNVQHQGKNLNMAYQAYVEMHKWVNIEPPKLKPSCSGCILQINKMLRNWFNDYDNQSVKIDTGGTMPISKAINAGHGNELIPIAARRKALEAASYKELKDQALEALGVDKMKTLNAPNQPKKAQLIDELLKL